MEMFQKQKFIRKYAQYSLRCNLDMISDYFLEKYFRKYDFYLIATISDRQQRSLRKTKKFSLYEKNVSNQLVNFSESNNEKQRCTCFLA